MGDEGGGEEGEGEGEGGEGKERDKVSCGDDDDEDTFFVKFFTDPRRRSVVQADKKCDLHCLHVWLNHHQRPHTFMNALADKEVGI